MSNPDAAAGPYAGNEKKPIGGNIMAHASTTRLALWAYVYDTYGLLAHIDFSSRKAAARHEPARYTTRRACPRWRHSLPSFKAASETPRKNLKVFNFGQTLLSFVNPTTRYCRMMTVDYDNKCTLLCATIVEYIFFYYFYYARQLT